ncbi:GNAT family N-acetyltransferase [Arthrobacter citreus]|uniref:GNAT family N-acetyltransferase n=1 Tax=Arthrobacter TaxID=1663 RepID=UPI0012650C3F|nr:GNAT family N-acetyltransferase [Arthrobacter gandavensis]
MTRGGVPISEGVPVSEGAPIREGTPRDIPHLARLRALWVAEAGGGDSADHDPFGQGFEDVFRTWLAANPRTFFVAEAEAGGGLIGMLNLSVFERMPKPGQPASVWTYLANAYVLPACRNAGVGTALVAAAVEYSRRLGAARIVTSPSPASKVFYARNGFEPADELAVYRFEAGSNNDGGRHLPQGRHRPTLSAG